MLMKTIARILKLI